MIQAAHASDPGTVIVDQTKDIQGLSRPEVEGCAPNVLVSFPEPASEHASDVKHSIKIDSICQGWGRNQGSQEPPQVKVEMPAYKKLPPPTTYKTTPTATPPPQTRITPAATPPLQTRITPAATANEAPFWVVAIIMVTACAVVGGLIWWSHKEDRKE